MRRAFWTKDSDGFGGGPALVFWLVAALLAPGCGRKPKNVHVSVAEPPAFQVIHPPIRQITRVIGQPSFIESYERTTIYPKMDAYIEKWNVDIGDKVKKGDTLATLFVPEIVEDFGTKNATVELDKERIELAEKLVTVADADVKAARAALEESKAILAKYQSETDRWDSEVKRLRNETEKGVVDPQVLLESINQLKSSAAARDAAKATIMRVDAELLSERPRSSRPRLASRWLAPTFGSLIARQGGSRHGWATSRWPHPTTARSWPVMPIPATSSCPPRASSQPCSVRLTFRLAVRRRSTWSTAPTWCGSSSTWPSKTPTTSRSGPRRVCSSRHIGRTTGGHRHSHIVGAARHEPDTSCGD